MTYREMIRRILSGVSDLDSEVRARVIMRGSPPNCETLWIKQVPVNYVGSLVFIEANDIDEAEQLP